MSDLIGYDREFRELWIAERQREWRAKLAREGVEKSLKPDERLDELGWEIFLKAVRLDMQPEDAADLAMNGNLHQRGLVLKDVHARGMRHHELEVRTKGRIPWHSSKTVAPSERLEFWQQSSRTNEFVYFVQLGESGPIKIGRAEEPRKRLKQLQTGSPIELVLRDVVPGESKFERALHVRFEPARIRGEWFGAEYLAMIRAYAEAIADDMVSRFDGKNIPRAVLGGAGVRTDDEIDMLRKEIERMLMDREDDADIMAHLWIDKTELDEHVAAMRESTLYTVRSRKRKLVGV